jgi:hypothetical protein
MRLRVNSKRKSFYAIFTLLSNKFFILSNIFLLRPPSQGFLSRGLHHDRIASVFRPTTLLTLVPASARNGRLFGNVEETLLALRQILRPSVGLPRVG